MKNIKIDKKSLESDILTLHKEIKELADYEYLPKIIIDIHDQLFGMFRRTIPKLDMKDL